MQYENTSFKQDIKRLKSKIYIDILIKKMLLEDIKSMKNINEEDFKQAIARKIKELRNTSQETLAENANLSEDTISKTEREVSIISSLTLVKLCNALNVTPNDILEEFLDVKPINNELNKEILTLNDEEKEFLLQTIRFIKRNKN